MSIPFLKASLVYPCPHVRSGLSCSAGNGSWGPVVLPMGITVQQSLFSWFRFLVRLVHDSFYGCFVIWVCGCQRLLCDLGLWMPELRLRMVDVRHGDATAVHEVGPWVCITWVAT